MQTRHTKILLLWLSAVLLLLPVQQSAAHNGKHAVAYPVDGIVVDGDLSDWPQRGMARHAISIAAAGSEPKNPQDYRGSFRLAYNEAENAIYIAIQAVDESVVLADGKTSDPSQNNDGSEVYLAVAHSDRNRFPVQQALWGKERGYRSNPEMATVQTRQIAVRPGRIIHQYEWRLDIEQMSSGQVQLAAGMQLGLDVAINDRDQDGSYSWMAWGPGAYKYGDPMKLGDVVLLAAGATPTDLVRGRLEGTAYWDGSDSGIPAAHIHLQSPDDPDIVFGIEADRLGHFALDLPVGTYQAQVAQPPDPRQIEIEITPDSTRQISLQAPLSPGRKLNVGAIYEQGPWFSLGASNGIHNKVHNIAQDQEGNMWFAVHGGGLYRWNGEDLTVFGTGEGLGTDIDLHALTVDAQGNIWTGSHDGISRYDGKSFKTFTSADGLSGATVYSIAADSAGSLWLATDAGLEYWDAKSPADKAFTHFPHKNGLPRGSVDHVYIDTKGHVWASTDLGLSRYDGISFTHFTTDDGLPGNNINATVEDRRGNLWIATYDGLSRYDGASFTHFTRDDSLADNNVSAVYVDADDNLWIGLAHHGAMRYDGRSFAHFTTDDGLIDNRVQAIFADREGHLWFGTETGVSRYEGTAFTNFTSADGLPQNDVWSLTGDAEGRVWFATHDGGLSRWDGRQFTNFSRQDGLLDNSLHRVYRDRQDQVWVGSHSGINRWDGDRFSALTARDGLVSNMIDAVVEDDADHMWFGTSAGLSRWDGSAFTNFTNVDGLALGGVNDLAVDGQKNLWIATDEGISRWDGADFTTLATAAELSNNTIHSILAADGQLWFGGSRGLIRYDGTHFAAVAAGDSAGSYAVFAIAQDQKGHLWFSNPAGGINHYDGLVNQTLNRADGLINDYVKDIYPDQNGDIWIATSAGVSRYRPRQATPVVAITGVVADRDELDPSAQVRRPAPQEYLAFHFAGQGYYRNDSHMAYAYRLKGHNDAWQVTRQTSVEFRDLPRRNYTFEVRAVDRDLNYSEPAQVRVEIHLAYERIAWIAALSLAVLIIAVLGVRVTRQRGYLRRANAQLSSTNQTLTQQSADLERANQTLKERAVELEEARQIADAANKAKSQFLANMSHEIRTPMNAILGYAQILQRSDDLASEHRSAIDTIRRSGDHLLKLINDVLDLSKIEAGRMELNPVDFDLNNMLVSIGAMFELQCQQKNLRWRLQGLSGAALPVHGDEDKLRQILINLLGNAVKFTPSGEIALHLEILPEQRYHLSVSDTGAGISAADQETLFQPFQQGLAGLQEGGTGLGLTISRRHLELMGSALELESTEGAGSRFSFTLELPPARQTFAAAAKVDRQVRSLAVGHSATALVVDDVEANRHILSQMLGDIGVAVDTADDGSKALEYLEENQPDIVFMDIWMPEMDGQEAMRRIHERDDWSQVKVVAVSASVLDHQRQEYLDAGFDDFVDKPFIFEQICASMARVLNIEFNYETPEPVAVASGPADWNGLTLATALHDKLREAAEIYSVTEMEDYYKEMEALGDDYEKLAVHLRGLTQQHDMDAILDILQEVPHE